MVALRVRYQTIELENVDIHVRTLRDLQQFEDLEGVAEKLGISSATWPIFGVIWPSGMVLAHLMLSYDIDNLRILEIGCGIGLASLVLNHRLSDITATDYHPEAEKYLIFNTALNDGKSIPFVQLDWSNLESNIGEFDLIIGSDVLYERSHINLLAAFLEKHTKPTSKIILIDPGRGNSSKFSKKMVSMGFTHTQSHPFDTNYLDEEFRGIVLEFDK